MNAIPDSIGDELQVQIVRLIQSALPAARSVNVGVVAPMFGGNARKAWSFDLAYRMGETHVQLPCVMLSQGGGRQIDTDVSQEFRVLQGLNGKGARVPAAVAMDPAGEMVGAPSIVLERLPGKASAVDFLNAPIGAGNSLTRDLVEVVAKLHSVDWDVTAFEPALAGLSPREIAARQVDHWYQTFQVQRMEPLPVMSSLFGWLQEHLPEPQRICLVHGDLRPGNFLYQQERVTGLLDWEMAHLGDPLEDLGWIFRPLWSPERFVPLDEFVHQYGERVGREIAAKDVLYYRVFSEMKFATISLTAARAFSASGKRNMRHADRAATVAPCLKRCLDWIESYGKESSHV